MCLGGILSRSGDTCCPASCGGCGGEGPSATAKALREDPDDALHGGLRIRHLSRNLKEEPPRCSSSSLFSTQNLEICVPGCDTRPGGSAQCCGGSIKRVCTSAAGPPPCRRSQLLLSASHILARANPPFGGRARGAHWVR